MGFHGQPAVETDHSTYLEEASLTHEEARGGAPSEHINSRPDKGVLCHAPIPSPT